MLLTCVMSLLYLYSTVIVVISVYTDRFQSSITNFKELLSTHQQQHLFVPIKGAEMEIQGLLNKPSIIPSEEVHYLVFILFSIYF